MNKKKTDGACGTYGRQERCIKGFGGETCVKRALGKSRRRWEDNIKMGLYEVGRGCMDWIDVDRQQVLVNAVMDLRVPKKWGEFFV
jgi:hypothetical protein